MKHVFLVDTSSKKSVEIGKRIETLGNKDYLVFYENDSIKMNGLLNSYFGQIHTLYCIGGDDFLNTLVNSLSYQVPIHVIPTGEENRFFENHKNVNDMLYADVGVLNGNIKFMTCAHFGMDQEISEAAYKEKRSLLNYAQMNIFSMCEGDEEEFLNINGIWNGVVSLSIYVGENQYEDRSIDSNFTVRQLDLEQYSKRKEFFKGRKSHLDPIQTFQVDSLNIKSIYPTYCWYDGIPMKYNQFDFDFDLIEQEVMITNRVPESIMTVEKTFIKRR